MCASIVPAHTFGHVIIMQLSRAESRRYRVKFRESNETQSSNRVMSGGLLRGLLLRPGGLGALRAVPRRTTVTTESGSILPRPERPYRSVGPVMVAIWAPPFIYGGAMIAKFFASWMEEMNIFVPDDDDDDD